MLTFDLEFVYVRSCGSSLLEAHMCVLVFNLKQQGTKKRKEAKKNVSLKKCDAQVQCDPASPKTCDAHVQCDLDYKERICQTRYEQLERDNLRLRPLVACHDERVSQWIRKSVYIYILYAHVFFPLEKCPGTCSSQQPQVSRSKCMTNA